MVEAGFLVFESDPAVLRWAKAAHSLAVKITQDPSLRATNLRHGETWFVGVDALPNAADGAIAGVPLTGPWEQVVTPPESWHRAQLSVVYPGYPRQDPGESDANHRFRRNRHAAHVDGLLPLGPQRRRHLKEAHAFILGIPLNAASAAPLVVYPGSHRLIGQALSFLGAAPDPSAVDLTEAYQAARREVLDQIAPLPLQAEPGQAILLHRHLVHGVAPWAPDAKAPKEGRMVAYFRPQMSLQDWIAPDAQGRFDP